MDRGEFLGPEHWLQLLALNADGEMTDAQFRAFVKHNLPTVIGFKTAMGKAKRTESTKDGWTNPSFDSGRDNHYDRSAEGFEDR